MPYKITKICLALAVGFFYIGLAAVLIAYFSPPGSNSPTLTLDSAMLDRVEQRYGKEAKRRFSDWEGLVASGKTLPESDKLRLVNDFFNRNVRFADDFTVWQQADYWATPFELLAKGAGDCEDFSIAKYFTLMEMGVADDKLRITYVKALALNQAHMVLTYFESPQSVPLVLDNLNPEISPASDRGDLLPVYSFNGGGLWLAKEKGGGRQVGAAERLNPWADLKRRMLEKVF